MSKIREHIPETTDPDVLDERLPAEGDLSPWVVFTRVAEGRPFVYAGWLDASDEAMALDYAKQHYGRDQQVDAVWAIPRVAMASTEPEYPPSAELLDETTWVAFTRSSFDDVYASAGTVEARSQALALEKARAAFDPNGDHHSLWVAEDARILRTDDDELVWRHCDQSYRMARGYSRDVRAKWEKIRADEDISTYEKDDLKDAF